MATAYLPNQALPISGVYADALGLGPNEIASPYTEENAQFGTVRAASFTFWYVQDAYLINARIWEFIIELRRTYGFRDLHEALNHPLFKSWWLKGLQAQLNLFQALALCAEAYNEAGQAFDVRPSSSRTLTGFNLQFWQVPSVTYNGKEYRQGDIALLRDRVPFEGSGVVRTDYAVRLDTPRQALIHAREGMEGVLAWSEHTQNLDGRLAYPVSQPQASSLAQTMGIVPVIAAPLLFKGVIIAIGVVGAVLVANYCTAAKRDRSAAILMQSEQLSDALTTARMYSEQCAQGNAEACALAEQWLRTATNISGDVASAIESENSRNPFAEATGGLAKLIKWGVIGGVAFYGFRQISEMQKARGE